MFASNCNVDCVTGNARSTVTEAVVHYEAHRVEMWQGGREKKERMRQHNNAMVLVLGLPFVQLQLWQTQSAVW